MSMAAVAIVEPPSNLRAELAEGIKAAWHKSCEHVLRIGRLLLEAKAKLAHGEFTQMILEDMPFGPRQAQTFMELARSPRLSNAKNPAGLPVRASTLKAIDSLSDGEYEAACFHGIIRQDVTEREVRDFQRQITRPETVETGAAWNELATKLKAVPAKPHRPDSAKCGPAVAPRDVELGRALLRQLAALHLTWPEMLWLMIDLRKSIPGQYEGNCLSQAGLDQLVGWGEGMTSHYETPEDDKWGRIPTAPNFLAWLQGCSFAIQRADAGATVR